MADKKRTLGEAKINKKDEFYTQLTDIEQELKHYRKHFKDKAVLCNCDDPFESNFFKYFVLNFNKLGLKKLIATSYATSPIAGTQFSYSVDKNGQMSFSFGGNKNNAQLKKAYKAVVNTVYDKTGNDAVEMLDVAELFESGENGLTELDGDGDFRSEECIELLKQADIVCTNPPFSLFREYVAQLMEYDKKFLIIGSQNAITYKEFFPLLKDNAVWLGYKFGDMAFTVPDDYEPRETRYWQDENGQKWRSMGNVCWYTNLDIKKRHEKLILIQKYDPEKYPKYDNYDAIEAGKTINIPCDYSGIIGVPITFMDKYNPDQFEIIGLGITDLGKSIGVGNYDRKYKTPASRDGTLYYVKDGKGVVPYARVLIRNKHPEQPKETK